MKPTEGRALRQLARSQGIQLSYQNIQGEKQDASSETLTGILQALGYPIQTPERVLELLDANRQAALRRPVQPVVVAWDGMASSVPVLFANGRPPRTLAAQLTLEDGTKRPLRIARNRGAPSRRMGDGHATGWFGEVVLPRLPPGYHRLAIETADGPAESLIIAAPTRSHSEPNTRKRWGVFLPLYAAHSRNSWGAGNFSDWATLSQWAATHGASVVGTLPLLAAFLDCPTCEPSPYAPASRLFWNEFYVDVERVPEFTQSREAQRLVRSVGFQRRLSAFRASGTIDYQKQMEARREVLELLMRQFLAIQTARRQEYRRFVAENPELERYAQFRAACEQLKSPWRAWPDRPRQGHLNKGDYDPRVQQYHRYVQWLAHEQMQHLVAGCRSRGLHLYLDLPLGVHPDGYDVWREQNSFALDASVGAPPDPFFSLGQNWGFPPLHPQRIREDGYRYVREYLRFQMRHTGLLRIDHVMGLHRLYWIPKGLPPGQGAYVSYQAEELYALLSLESQRHQTVLVGENLGTVPPEVNSSMDRHQLRRMCVVQFEQRDDPRQALTIPPRRCVASVNTHDMPTFAAHWRGKDISDRKKLGLLRSGEVGAERARRQQVNYALMQFLKRQGWIKPNQSNAQRVWQACIHWLGASPAEIVLLNLEDAWLEEQPQNVPGTSRERPNWRRKATRALEEILHDSHLATFLKEVQQIRAGKKETRPTSTASRKDAADLVC